ncbi:hypothetical protein RB195_001301 [Necator americanus]|uniref:Uncharacterized protein n=1 Tax=Necator americanus TaxID=51031 RepID=A0ABR1DDM1_NECAM
MHPHVSSNSVSIRSVAMLGVTSTMSSAKRKWCVDHQLPLSSHSNFRIAFSRVAVNILGEIVSPLHVNDDVLVEWRDSGREVTVQLSKYLYILSRDALVVQGFHDRFVQPSRKPSLSDEGETERHLVLVIPR